MELLQLRYFRAAAQTENFSRVAEQFYVPQSAVSRTITRLERELSVSLFDRIGRRVVLNENGRLLLRYADSALRGLDEATALLTGEVHEKILLSLQAGSRLMPEVLAGFRARHPQTEFSLSASELAPLPNVCAIRLWPVSPEWRFCRLFTEELLLAVPLTHPLSAQAAVSPAQLQGESFITFSRQKELRATTDEAFAAMGLRPKIAFECADAATLRGLVENGLGVALVPRYTWQFMPSDRVRLLPVEGVTAQRTLVFAWSAREEPSHGVRLFRDYCTNWFSHIG